MSEGPVPKRSVPRVLVSNRQDLPVPEEELAALAVSTLEAEGIAGDELSLSFVTPEEMAALHNPDLKAELRLLVVHGTLHVLGYDHEEDDQRTVMWERQERYSGVRAG